MAAGHDLQKVSAYVVAAIGSFKYFNGQQKRTLITHNALIVELMGISVYCCVPFVNNA